MRAAIENARLAARPIHAFVGRSFSLTLRYWGWEVTMMCYSIAMVLAIGFLAVGVGQVSGKQVPTDKVLVYLLTGSLLWQFMSQLFWETSNIMSFERWEGTIEYTFMAPASRVAYLLGMSAFSALYAGVRLVVLVGVCLLMFKLDLSHANVLAAALVLGLSSFSLVGLGLMAASLPLVFTERGTQMTTVIEACLLMISGVYYPITVLPGWLQFISQFSPMTYTLHGMRAAMLEGASIAQLRSDLIPLAVTAVLLVPLGLRVFAWTEAYCKRHGKLKRSG